MNIEKIKKDFPIFVNQPDLVYLDNASTTQMPQVVIDAVSEYYSKYKANVHRAVYKLGEAAEKKYEEARQTAAEFLNAEREEIIFTSGTTAAINGLAFSLGQTLRAGDNVVLTRMEHHANLIPWQQMSRRYGFELRFIDMCEHTNSTKLRTTNFELDLEQARKVIDENTKIVSFIHISNTLGTINPAREIVQLAKAVGAITIIDAAQSVAHIKLDVRDLDCDFLTFSGHKLGGPTGSGVLFGKKDRLAGLAPFLFGGGMISTVSYERSEWAEAPHKFEAGTPNIAGAIGLAAALKYLQSIGWDEIRQHEKELLAYAREKLRKIDALKIIGPNELAGVISFTLGAIHPHDIATVLDRDRVAVRAGHHCTLPLMDYLKIGGTTRASFWIYNNKSDVDRLVVGIKKTLGVFRI